MTLNEIVKAVRAVIYGRYSSDAQRQTSIVDQVRRCTRYAQEEGFTVVREYADEALKGWDPERSQFKAMLLAARAGEFDVLLVDDLSRAFRDLGAQSNVLQQLRIYGVRVISVADGWDSAAPGSKLTAGIKGLMNEHFLDALGELTFRGQEGRILSGLSAGGDIYGYKTERVEFPGRKAADYAHRRVVDETEADVVREIYTLFADGNSPAAIAEVLNGRGVEAPRKKLWSRNAIYGDKRDLSGILNNPIYVGEVVWGRSKFLRNPETGKRVKVRKPESQWTRRSAPELRIVSGELFAAAQERLARTAKKGDAIREALANPAARGGADGKYILTGLLRCGVCGGPVSSTARDTFGCSARHNRGTFACTNDVKFSRSLAEREILTAVQTQLFSPSTVERLCELVATEYTQQCGAGSQLLSKLTKSLAATEKAVSGCVSFVEAGNASESVAKRLKQLEAEAAATRAEIAKAVSERPVTEEGLRSLKQNAIAALQDLPALLAGSEAEVRHLLAHLLGEASVTPVGTEAVEIQLTGHVAGLLSLGGKQRRRRSDAPKKIGSAESADPMLGSVVARARFELATFGL
jgi:site-specific DNA recombinase